MRGRREEREGGRRGREGGRVRGRTEGEEGGEGGRRGRGRREEREGGREGKGEDGGGGRRGREERKGGEGGRVRGRCQSVPLLKGCPLSGESRSNCYTNIKGKSLPPPSLPPTHSSISVFACL